MISRMPAPPIVNNLELRDGWSVDISTIHNGRFSESAAFIMKDGKSVRGYWSDEDQDYIHSSVNLTWAIGHMEAGAHLYHVLQEWLAEYDGPLDLRVINRVISSARSKL